MRKLIPLLMLLVLSIPGFAQKKVDIEKAKYFFNQGLEEYLPDYAVDSFSIAIDSYPGFAKAFLERGKNYHSDDNKKAALSDFTSAIKISPSLIEAYVYRAYIIDNTAKNESARKDLIAALKYSPATNEDNIALVVANYMLGNVRAAQEHCDDIVENQIYWFAINKGAREDYILNADYFLDKEFKDKRTHPQKKADLSMLKSCLSVYDANNYNAAIALDPNNPDLYVYKAFAYERDMDRENLEQTYTKAAELYKNKGDNLKSAYFLARVKFLKTEYTAALKILNSIDVSRSPSYVVFLKALTLYRLGEYKAALQNLNRLEDNKQVLYWKIESKKKLDDETFQKDQAALEKLTNTEKYGF